MKSKSRLERFSGQSVLIAKIEILRLWSINHSLPWLLLVFSSFFSNNWLELYETSHDDRALWLDFSDLAFDKLQLRMKGKLRLSLSMWWSQEANEWDLDAAWSRNLGKRETREREAHNYSLEPRPLDCNLS